MSVYVNRILNLKNMKVIGFDMDHTLVRYHSEIFEELAFKVVLDKLVKLKNYPEEILDFEFDYTKVVRGLVFDKVRGNVLKLSRYSEVKMGIHGLNPLTYDMIRKIYKGLHIDLTQNQYYSLDTNFSISTGLIFSLLVNLKDNSPAECFPKGYTYFDIFTDIDTMINLSHMDGSLKEVVKNDLTKYVIKDEEIVDMLQVFKKEGKILMIITNSDYDYTRVLLDYCINPYLAEGQSWQDIFDYVITNSEKPRFFTEKSKFLKVDRETGLMSNWTLPLQKGIYQGGCAMEFQKQLHLKGSQILYLGDHIYGDIVTLKKSCDWKTGLVVDELSAESLAIQKSNKIQKKLDKLMAEKEALELELEALEGEEYNAFFKKIIELDETIYQNIIKFKSFFNPIWGPIMRAGIEDSRLANQIERFACIYMSKISNLKDYSPKHYFRPKRRLLPHEL